MSLYHLNSYFYVTLILRKKKKKPLYLFKQYLVVTILKKKLLKTRWEKEKTQITSIISPSCYQSTLCETNPFLSMPYQEVQIIVWGNYQWQSRDFIHN